AAGARSRRPVWARRTATRSRCPGPAATASRSATRQARSSASECRSLDGRLDQRLRRRRERLQLALLDRLQLRAQALVGAVLLRRALHPGPGQVAPLQRVVAAVVELPLAGLLALGV